MTDVPTKDYLNLMSIIYNAGDYIEEFGGYYAGVINNYILIFLDYHSLRNYFDKYLKPCKYYREDELLLLMNNNKYNGFDDYSNLTVSEINILQDSYNRLSIDGYFCRRVYIND